MGHDKLFQKRRILSRSQKNRQIRRILIVCEGEKTEPNYFKGFKDNNLEVYDCIDIHGTGYNTESLVKEAIRIRNEAVQRKEPYIETWCVFDKDDFSDQSFANAKNLAEKNQIKCAYSIEAFEIWYLLHFDYCDSALSRHQYSEKLSEKLKEPYKKNDTGMYSKLLKFQNKAIQNAQKLYCKQCLAPLKDQNPITTVFQLVERLL